ncbi:MAG: hypothetical protein JWR18_2380, partial [Segetibacter sp.]|nr:hypothetical protein [Segetibacter sp.]
VSEVILPGKQFKNRFYQFDPCHPCSIVFRKKMSTHLELKGATQQLLKK